jgi:hypothetical protein
VGKSYEPEIIRLLASVCIKTMMPDQADARPGSQINIAD